MPVQCVTGREQALPGPDKVSESPSPPSASSVLLCPLWLSVSLYQFSCVMRLPTVLVLTVRTPSQHFGGWGRQAGGRRPLALSLAAWRCWWLLSWSGCSGSSEELARLCACLHWSGCRRNDSKSRIRIIPEKKFLARRGTKPPGNDCCLRPDGRGKVKSFIWDNFSNERYSPEEPVSADLMA